MYLSSFMWIKRIRHVASGMRHGHQAESFRGVVAGIVGCPFVSILYQLSDAFYLFSRILDWIDIWSWCNLNAQLMLHTVKKTSLKSVCFLAYFLSKQHLISWCLTRSFHIIYTNVECFSFISLRAPSIMVWENFIFFAFKKR